MIVTMIKQKESNEFIWYTFCTEIQSDSYIDSKGRSRAIYVQKCGKFKFDKIHDLKEKSIEMIADQTDQILLADKNIKFACLQKMLECKKNNTYDDIVVWASC